MANNVTDLGKVGITLKGEWNSSASYERLDTVTYEGSLYIAVKDNVGSQPSESNTNWMLGAKHGEFTEQQLEDFKAEVVAESKEEMDSYTDDKKTELDTYTGTKKTELDTYEGTKEAELNTYASGLKDDFDSNATSKTNAFNTNAASKTSDFDSNAVAKTTAFDTNATTKTNAFDDNATAKTTAFDENAEEKTGDFNDNVDTKTAEFDTHVEEKEAEFDENVDSIQEQITDIQEFIDSELEQGITEKGTRADVSDSAKWYGELAPEGRTTQNVDELIYKCDGTETGDYYLVYNSISYQFTIPAIESGDILIFNTSTLELSLNGITIATTEGTTGTELTFVASPNPDFPQEIQNVEGRSCRNLFNKDTTTTGYRIVWATGEPYAEPTAEISDFIEIKGDTDYILTNKCYIIAYDDAKQYLGSLTNTGIAKSNGITTSNFKLSNDVKYVKLLKYGGANNFIGFQMNEGNTLLPYEEYFEGKRLELNVCNKNLWQDMGDIEKETSSTLSAKRINNVYFLNGTFGESVITDKAFSLTNLSYTNYYTYLNILPGMGMSLEPGTYTCSMKNFKGSLEGTATLKVVKTGKTPSNRTSIASSPIATSKNITFTLTEPTEIFIAISFAKTTEFNNISFEIQLEKNNTETDFVKSTQQLIPFPLQDAQKLMEGDYLANDGVHHVKNIVDMSTLSYSFVSSNDTFQTTISDIKRQIAGTKFNGKATSYSATTCATNTKWAEKSNGTVGLRSGSTIEDSTHIVCFKDNRFVSATDFKNAMANNYLLYELAQEVIDTYTEEQAEAYNKLKKIMLNQGVNHIWTETDGLEPNMQLTYYKSNKQRLNNIEARLELLEN